MRIGNVLMNAFSGGGAGRGALGGGLGGGTQANADGSNFGDLSPFGSAGGSGAGGSDSQTFQDANFQDASFNDEEDFGDDLGGGGDDWA
jgi:hypothetical protein